MNFSKFRFGGVCCGIRPSAKLDLAGFISSVPCNFAHVSTRNVFAAPPVLYNRELAESGRRVRGLVVNSGVANAATGSAGMEATRRMAATFENVFGIEPGSVLVSSTGVIGVPLPLDKINRGIALLPADMSEDGGLRFAAAITTTDKFEKIAFRETERLSVFGVAKGAGMIHPAMATMLVYLFTNVSCATETLQDVLEAAVANSFNRMSVDGDMSTNDTVILISPSEGEPADELEFRKMVNDVCFELMMKILEDGEGATHIIKTTVSGEVSNSECLQIARSVGTSQLVKTAVYGGDMNWGRILAAAGAAGVLFDPRTVSLNINGITVFYRGEPVSFDEQLAALSMKKKSVSIHLKIGDIVKSEEHFYSSDLTEEYVRFNSNYTT